MNLEEIRKNAWSLRPDEMTPGQCIAKETRGDITFYYYGPDEEGKHRYRSSIDLAHIEREKKRKRERRSIL